jgi:hypothetical protein
METRASRWRMNIEKLAKSEAKINDLQRCLTYLRNQTQVPQQTSDRSQNTEVHVMGIEINDVIELDRRAVDSQRKRDPFETERVKEIIEKVDIGDDLTPEQKERVSTVIREFAD